MFGHIMKTQSGLTRDEADAKILFMKAVLITVYADLSALPSLRDRYGSLLSEYRKEKMARFRNNRDALPGELAEYCLIEAVLRADPKTELPLSIKTTDLGKPSFTECPFKFSLSHAGDYAAATVSDSEVGTDVERERPVNDSLAKRICTAHEWENIWQRNPSEETLIHLFSAKESIVKMSGEGIRSLGTVDTCEYPVRQRRFPGYVLSVCTLSAADWEVVQICG